MSKIQISELTESLAALDSDWLAIEDENGTATKKISVENFNETAAHSAKAYAEAAEQSATDASGYKDSAKDYKDEATIQAGNAADSATSASGYATSAQGYATEASGYVGTAYTHASNASNSAIAAAASAATADGNANLAKSWAIGETGLRADEAVNNSRYWASVAQAIAGGGVASFNGRGGAVVPQAHDYNAGMVDYSNTSSGMTATNVQDAIDEVASNINTINGKIGSTDISTIGDGEITGAISFLNNGKSNKSTVKTATLSAGNTTVTFTQLPTSGNYLIEFFSSTGINYTEIDTSVPGQVTLTYEEQEAAVTISCEIKEA